MRYAVAVLFACALHVTVMAQTPIPSTPEEIDARIQELESAMIKAQADRYRAKHAMEYGDDSVKANYAKAKELESELIDLRKELNERLAVVDDTIRTGDADVAKQYQQINDLRLLTEAIRRELSFAERMTTNAADPELVALKTELAQSETEITTLQAGVKQAMETLKARKLEMAAGDKEAVRLSKKITEREAIYEREYGELQVTMDQTDAVKALDAQRGQLMQELQELRARKSRMADPAPGTP